jgi:hypothetical protein
MCQSRFPNNLRLCTRLPWIKQPEIIVQTRKKHSKKYERSTLTEEKAVSILSGY